MKYKIVLISENEQHKINEYSLEDEYGKVSYWIEWHESDQDNIIRTTHQDSSGQYLISIDAMIPINKDNPEESIERLKKLAVLK